VLHAISLGTALAILWLALSGMFVPLLLSLGVASVVLTVWISHRMDVVDHEGHPIHLGLRGLLYFPWLAFEIIKANMSVAKIILSPRMNIQPHIFKTTATQRSEVGLVAYANSITLTPGTVTIAMANENVFEVHALTHDAREGVESLNMDRRCAAMEGPLKPAPKQEPTL